MPDVFWGLSAAGWTAVGAIGTLFLALITAILVAVGVSQIRVGRDEARLSRTLAACDRYDTDPVLDASLHRLAEARDSDILMQEPAKFRTDITTLLNYLSSLAVGIEQDLYDGDVIRDHMEPVIKWHVAQYLAPSSPQVLALYWIITKN